MREGEAFEGAAADRRARELSRISAALKREVARGEHAGVELRDLLVRDRPRAGAAAGEDGRRRRRCSTSATTSRRCGATWCAPCCGELAADVHVIGLTATPPVGLPEAEAELYDALLGPVDFTVPTPAVVRDGHLAPYQELALADRAAGRPSASGWPSTTPASASWSPTLHDDAEATSPRAWVIGAPARPPALRRRRDRAALGGVPEAHARSSPAPASASCCRRACGSRPARPRGEAYRQPPDLDDWLVLLEDYALRCLRAEPAREAADRYDAIAAALRELGFNLTRQGIRRGDVRGRPAADRLAGQGARRWSRCSRARPTSAATRMRALVLCDAELASQRPDDALTGVLDPAAGHRAPRAAGDRRRRPHRPICARCWSPAAACAARPHDADVLLEALRGGGRGALHADRVGGRARRPARRAALRRRRVDAARVGGAGHALLVDGTTRVLVGTRALLGEGWNCPPLNVLVDMTIATTGVSVQQMRGRSLRLDPADPQKVASNWDVVCVAPDLVRGTRRLRALRAQAPAPVRARRGRRGRGGPVARAPGAGAVRPPPVERFARAQRASCSRAPPTATRRASAGRSARRTAASSCPTLLVRPLEHCRPRHA